MVCQYNNTVPNCARKRGTRNLLNSLGFITFVPDYAKLCQIMPFRVRLTGVIQLVDQ